MKLNYIRVFTPHRDADGELSALDDNTDLEASLAASVNLPPVGTHDTSDVPDEVEINGVTITSEDHHADD